jgi:hypothetical protein
MKVIYLVALGATLGLTVTTSTFAQSAPGQGDVCRPVFDEAAKGCAEIASRERLVQKWDKDVRAANKILSASDATAEAKQAAEAQVKELGEKIAATKREIERLTDTPFEALPGFCKAIGNAGTPRTCESLASLLGAFTFDEGSLKSLAKATKEGESPETQDLLRTAALSDRRTANNKSGSSAQLEPVESIQPITVAGGALTLAGTRSGSKGVGTISVNPLALAMPDDVQASRFADLSVSAPFDLGGNSSNEDPYISARLRVNITGPFNAAELQKHVDAWLSASGIYADKLEQVFLNAKDVKACARYVAINHRAGISACSQDLDSADVRQLQKQAYAAMARARRAADKCYLGVDARFDTGDPTGPDIAHDKGKHFLGGFAGGVRIPHGSLWDWELRARTALDYFKSQDLADTNRKPVGSFDWGGALIFSGRLQESAKQRMAFGVGAEGRHAWKDDENAKRSPTNYVKLNLMAVVPAVAGGDLGLALGIPLWELREMRGLMVNFSTDLGLLDHSL